MKKSTWLLIIAAVLTVGVIVGGVIGFLLGGDGSGEPHTHAFTRKDTSADYLKDKATCQSPAVYYYSCACGEGGTETFTSGDLGDHSYENRACTACGALLPSEGIVFQSNGDGTCAAISIGTCTDPVIVIPAVSPAGDRVTTLGGLYNEDKDDYTPFLDEDHCDETCKFVSLILPEGLETIHSEAVQCERLMFLSIPDSVTEIGEEAFGECTGLVRVTLGKGLTSIGDYAFDSDVLFEVYNRSSLPIVAGDDGFGKIAAHAKNVYTDESGESKIFTDSDGFVFYNDGKEAYLLGHEQYWTITDLVLPEDCHGEKYAIVTFFFFNLDNIVSVTIPDAVTSIGREAFTSCPSLTSVIIGNGVKAIYDSAFSGCAANTEGIRVVLGSGIELVDTYVFYFSTVDAVYYNGTESDWNGIEFGGSTEELTRPDRYYYSESQPTADGNYWHWVDGVPTAW